MMRNGAMAISKLLAFLGFEFQPPFVKPYSAGVGWGHAGTWQLSRCARVG